MERAYGTATNHLWFVWFLARPVLMCSLIIVEDILGERQRELTSKGERMSFTKLTSKGKRMSFRKLKRKLLGLGVIKTLHRQKECLM